MSVNQLIAIILICVSLVSFAFIVGTALEEKSKVDQSLCFRSR